MRPKSETDCRFCRAEKGKRTTPKREKPVAWQLRKGRGGRKKRIPTEGYFCPNKTCEYYGIDELWANVKDRSQDMWLWIASDAKTKIIPIMQVGPRHQEMAFSVVHELKQRLASGCVPVFSTDGLKHYYYALTAHFGKWEMAEEKKPVWVVLNEFVYSQVIKHQRRRKTVEVERRVLVGEIAQYTGRLRQAGLSGRINTAFVERMNLTIRQCVSKLTRRTWGPAKFTPELMEHLEWWRSYYHFVRTGHMRVW